MAVQLGEWVIYPEKFIIESEQGQVKLKSLCMRLLVCLIAHDGNVASKDVLIEQCWDGRIVSDDAIRQAVKDLRDALGCNGYASNYVETVRKQGYRLLLPVTEPLAKEPNEPTETAEQGSRWTLRKICIPCALVFVTIFGLLFGFSQHSTPNATLSDRAITITHHNGREFDYTLSKQGWDAYVLIAPGTMFGASVLIRDAQQEIRHTLSPKHPAGHLYSPVFSPNGEQLAYLDFHQQACNIRIIERLSGQETTSIQCQPSDVRIALDWQNDEELLYSSSAQSNHPLSLRSYNLRTLEQKQITSPPIGGRGDYHARHCAGNDTLILRTPDWQRTELLHYNKNTEKVTSLLNMNEVVITADWFDNCTKIAFFQREKGLQSFDLHTQQISSLGGGHLSNVLGLTIVNDAFFISQGELASTEIIGLPLLGGQTDIKTNSSGNSDNYQQSPTEPIAAFSSDRTGIPQLWWKEEGEHSPKQISHFTTQKNISAISWSMDGEHLWFSHGKNIWNFDLKKQVLTLQWEVGSVINDMIVTPSHEIIYTVHQNGLWQGYIWRPLDTMAKPLSSLALVDVKRNQLGEIIFKTQEGALYQYSSSSRLVNLQRNITESEDWSLTSKYLITFYQGELTFYDRVGNKVILRTEHNDTNRTFTLSHDERFIYFDRIRSDHMAVAQYQLL